jgi:hypothetical protein
VTDRKVLSGLFGSKRKETPAGRRKSHNKKLRKFYCSPNSVTVMTSREWGTGLAARWMGEMRNA